MASQRLLVAAPAPMEAPERGPGNDVMRARAPEDDLTTNCEAPAATAFFCTGHTDSGSEYSPLVFRTAPDPMIDLSQT